MTDTFGLPDRNLLLRLRDIAATRQLHILALGAGTQSTTIAHLAATGAVPDVIPRFDVMIFADTGWESRLVYDHLTRIEAFAAEAGIPLVKTSRGNIREDALRPTGHYFSMPLHTLSPTGHRGIMKRGCTRGYKIEPLERVERAFLGAPIDANGNVGKVPAGRGCVKYLGISEDESRRALDDEAMPRYSEVCHPLIELHATRQSCKTYLANNKLGDCPESSCVPCPFHGNRRWREMRDQRPAEWQAACAFDESIRHGHPAAGTPLNGTAYLHRARVPLSEAPIDVITPKERREQQGELNLVDLATFEEDPPGCGLYACRTTEIPQAAALEAGA
ncbi:hypothetical protein [Nonomuraea sp. SYSU D8015]|uniref:hypothetical protein n=1 Tax=Nonomuraea sp. SYSU D8015 TaxID=2593644 RepID=UPI00166161FB|nr:hypothetical protein [Nonomuraea sp. SYSU D8015]